MNTFVTFDLDYWTMTNEFNSSHTDYLQSLIDKADAVRVVKLHHHVVTRRMISKSIESVINIDFHNDIVDECPHTDFNEGTWGNFMPVNVRKFTWVYPDEEECVRRKLGVCIGTELNPKITHVKYKKICGYENIHIDSIRKFVICLSEQWAEYDISPYLKFLKKSGLISS